MKTSKIVTSGAALTLAIFLGIAGVASAQNGDGHGPADMGPGMGFGMGFGWLFGLLILVLLVLAIAALIKYLRK